MVAYILRRIAIAIPMLIIATFIMFVLTSLSGDPLAAIKETQPPPDPAMGRQLEHQFYLDQPFLERYFTWLGGVLHGYFGPSIKNLDIGAELASRFWVTFRLVVLAFVIAVVLAIIIGLWNSVRRYKLSDHISTFVTFLLLSMPLFWLAMLFKQWAVSANRAAGDRIFYTIGDGSTITNTGGFWGGVMLFIGVMTLPTLAMAFHMVGKFSRYTRASMLDVLDRGYMELATAKGLTRRRVLVRHGLRTALIPFVTVTAMEIGAVLGGTMVLEQVFQWHGLGDLILTAITNNDIYVILSWMLIAAGLVILFNLIADLLYGLLDPRVRVAGGQS
jgi:peptide/nickel transport system permease protein